MPLTRVENAIAKLKPRIDADQPADKQVAAMMGKLVDILPLRKGNAAISGVVTVPSKHVGPAGTVVRKHSTVKEEEFGPDGARWTVECHDYDALVRELAKSTKGEYEFSAAGVVESGGGSRSDADTPDGGGKKKKGRGRK